MMFSAIFFYGRRLLSSPPFTKYLFFTNVIASGVIDSAGDLVTQKGLERAERNDWYRTGRMGFMGLTLGIPYHYWYIYLDRWYPSQRAAHIGSKVLLDIFISGPISIALFYIGEYCSRGLF